MEAPTKKWFHDQGIPAGVGIPENPDEPKPGDPNYKSPEEMEAEEEEMAENMAMGAMGEGGGYVQQMAPGDKARILQYIHTNLPLQKNTSGKLTGEVPENMFYAFYGWLAHNASLGDMTEEEIRGKQIELDIQELEIMMAMDRGQYSPQVNADLRNAKHICNIKLTQNRDGKALYLAHAEVSEDLRAFRVLKGKQASKGQVLANHIRGR